MITARDFPKRRSIMVLFSFLVTFALSRLVVYLIDEKMGGGIVQYVVVNEIHIHHFVYGIFICLITGFIALFTTTRKIWQFIMFGVGLGLIVDEFALWIRLNSDYYQFSSIVAVSVVTILLILSAFIEHLYNRV